MLADVLKDVVADRKFLISATTDSVRNIALAVQDFRLTAATVL